jgi:hypothetical protein
MPQPSGRETTSGRQEHAAAPRARLPREARRRPAARPPLPRRGVSAAALLAVIVGGCSSGRAPSSPAAGLSSEEARVVAQQGVRREALRQAWGGDDEAPVAPSVDEKRVLNGIRQTLRATMPRFLDCYERGGDTGRGPLLLRIVFDTQGEVVEVQPQASQGLSPIITACAVLTAWTLQLPAQPAERLVVTIALDYPSSRGGSKPDPGVRPGGADEPGVTSL